MNRLEPIIHNISKPNEIISADSLIDNHVISKIHLSKLL